MKLTESRIKEIILEEIENAEKDKEQNQNVKSDVALIKKEIHRIDTHEECAQILTLILKHDFNDPQRKKIVLRKVRDELNKILAGS